MPVGRTGHLSQQARICQRMVEVAGLPVEGVGVGVGAVVLNDQVGEIVARAGCVICPKLDRSDRIFLGIRVVAVRPSGVLAVESRGKGLRFTRVRLVVDTAPRRWSTKR